MLLSSSQSLTSPYCSALLFQVGGSCVALFFFKLTPASRHKHSRRVASCVATLTEIIMNVPITEALAVPTQPLHHAHRQAASGMLLLLLFLFSMYFILFSGDGGLGDKANVKVLGVTRCEWWGNEEKVEGT